MKDKQDSHTIVPLSEMKNSEKGKIISLEGGKCFLKRLHEMGLRKDVEIEVISNRGGPVSLRCGETRLAIGHDMASRIYVQKIS